MKKLFLLFPLFAFQCETETTPMQTPCNCVEEIVYINDGIDTVLIEKTSVPSYKCELWGYGQNYLPIPKSVFYNRFICE